MTHHLAQLNIARLAAPLDSKQLSGFVANLDQINRLAEKSPGFVWRYESPIFDTTSADHPFGSDYIVNMSLWDSVEALHDYTYRSAHKKVMARRNEWFIQSHEAQAVLWWAPAGRHPTPFDAAERLHHLRREGPTDYAFTFKQAFSLPV